MYIAGECGFAIRQPGQVRKKAAVTKPAKVAYSPPFCEMR